MARRKAAEAATATPRKMDGNVSRATFLAHTDILIEKLRVKKEADSALANAYKRAEEEGIDRKELKRAMADMNLSHDDLDRRDRKYILYREWLARPVGFQPEIPMPDAAPPGANGAEAPEATPQDLDEAEAVERHSRTIAYERGIEIGKAGADLASCGYEVGSQEYAEASAGWAAGQRAAVAALEGATRVATH